MVCSWEYRDRAAQSKQRPLRGDHGLKDTGHQRDETRRSGLESVHPRLIFHVVVGAPSDRSASELAGCRAGVTEPQNCAIAYPSEGHAGPRLRRRSRCRAVTRRDAQSDRLKA